MKSTNTAPQSDRFSDKPDAGLFYNGKGRRLLLAVYGYLELFYQISEHIRMCNPGCSWIVQFAFRAQRLEMHRQFYSVVREMGGLCGALRLPVPNRKNIDWRGSRSGEGHRRELPDPGYRVSGFPAYLGTPGSWLGRRREVRNHCSESNPSFPEDRGASAAQKPRRSSVEWILWRLGSAISAGAMGPDGNRAPDVHGCCRKHFPEWALAPTFGSAHWLGRKAGPKRMASRRIIGANSFIWGRTRGQGSYKDRCGFNYARFGGFADVNDLY
jgi:hypothetical protein